MNDSFFDFGFRDPLEFDPPPESIAPAEDNPMPRWVQWGVRLAGKSTRLAEPDLWPREFDYNPMVIYLTSRRRGQRSEDWVGLAPWLGLTVIEAALVLGPVSPVAKDTLWLLLAAPLLAPLVGLLSLWMVVRYLNRTLNTLSFEQLVVTRLSSAHLVHGLMIRPLAVQTVGCYVNVIAWIPLLALSELGSTNSVWNLVYPFATGIPLLLLRWALFTSSLMTGATLGIRAYVFIRPLRMAYIRMLSDWVRRMLLPMCLMLGVLMASMSNRMMAWVAVLVCIPILVYYGRQGFTAEDVLRWVAENQSSWWVIAGDDAPQIPQLPWQPWKSLDPDLSHVPQR